MTGARQEPLAGPLTGAPEIPGALIARAEPVDDGHDPLELFRPGEAFAFLHPTRAVVGAGAALTIPVPGGPGQVARAAERAEAALARIAVEGGPGPVVVGALPFDGRFPATLVVPRVVLLRGPDGRAWRVRTGPEDEHGEGPSSEVAGEGSGVPGPPSGSTGERMDDERFPAAPGARRLEVTPIPEPDAYRESVRAAVRLISSGRLEKVVLARTLVAQSDREFDRKALLRRLVVAEPDAYVFAVHGFVGASPELLVAREGREIRSNPMAGTAARRADIREDLEAARLLLSSAKDRGEHALVADAVRLALAEVCRRIEAPREPVVMGTSKVWHLSTQISGTLRRDFAAERAGGSLVPSALALAARLHPTPAVAGTPTDAAMSAIGDLERIERTVYAGLVGWMDATGDGEWAIALRCAEIQGRIAMLFAGAGIVADSDPDAELAETEAKFRSMLDALAST